MKNMADSQDSATPKASGNHAANSIGSSLPLKYKLPFYGRVYQMWSKFIHKHGYHYAPKKYPPEPNKPTTGLGGKPIKEWYHWCHWCGLRGKTIDVIGKED